MISCNFGGNSELSSKGGTGSCSRIALKITAEVAPVKGGRPVAILHERAKGEEVAADIEFLAAGLLGGHVGDGADRRAWAGEMGAAGSCLRDHGVHGYFGGACEFGKTEVQNLDWATLGEKDVRG